MQDHEVYEEATLVQSGVYRLRRGDGTWVTKGRGFADRNIPWEEVLDAWRKGAWTLAVVSKDRFIGLGAALPGERWEMWRRFVSIPKELQLTAIGKRWDLVPPDRWTAETNPATGPTRTEPTDPFLMGLVRGVEDLESTAWKPKFEDPDVRTAEEGAESVESALPAVELVGPSELGYGENALRTLEPAQVPTP